MKIFSESVIQEAIENAEKNCSAEFSVVIAQSSDSYQAAYLRWMMLLQISTAIILFLVEQFKVFGQWHDLYTGHWTAALILISALISYFFCLFVPKIRLILIDKNEIIKKVREAALASFSDLRLHKTSHRRTVLIFISQLEKRIDLVVDIKLEGILNEVKIAQLEDIYSSLLKKGNQEKIILKILKELSELLKENGFPPDGTKGNEISNKPVNA